MTLGGGGIRYMKPIRGGEVKSKSEMKRPYWVYSSSIAWSLTDQRIRFIRLSKMFQSCAYPDLVIMSMDGHFWNQYNNHNL